MENELLKWCIKNFDFDTQQWTFKSIPDEIIDYALGISKEWWPRCENEADNDFINDFIYEHIVCSKYWDIVRIWLKEDFEDRIKGLFDNK